MKNFKKIIIVCGDPNSINSEIIYKSFKKLDKKLKKKIFLIGNVELIKKQFKKLQYPAEVLKVKNLNVNNFDNKIKIIDVPLEFKNPFDVNKKSRETYIYRSLNLGHKYAIRNDVSGFINCAINKRLFKKKNIGVTEFLAKKCKINKNSEVMMIRNKYFAVCPITTHLDLKNVSKEIKTKKIISKIKTIQKFYFEFFDKKPKIGVLGLNPHNAELRKGSEEISEIIPAIKKLRRLGLKIEGPLVADTIFVKNYKNFNVVVGMYHDQVLAPFKSLFKLDGINITLGLEYLRASPDHGVADDLVLKNKANPSSLIECIKFINKFGK